jgi:methylglutaconyl-CoA hydratase
MISTDYQYILTEVNQKNLNITLNRPEKRNALNDSMVTELKDVLKKTEQNSDIRTLTLKARGDAFCSGADLEYLKTLRKNGFNDNLKDSKKLAELFYQIYSFPKPTIAIVQGAALAGGCGLATVCDFVLASENALFGYPEVKIGFIAAIVSVFLIRQAGERVAKELLLSGEVFSGRKAKEMGLISFFGSAEALARQYEKLVDQLNLNSPQAMQYTKQMVIDFEFTNIKESLEKFSKLNAQYRLNDDFLEGISSFLNKTKPSWSIKENLC